MMDGFFFGSRSSQVSVLVVMLGLCTVTQPIRQRGVGQAGYTGYTLVSSNVPHEANQQRAVVVHRKRGCHESALRGLAMLAVGISGFANNAAQRVTSLRDTAGAGITHVGGTVAGGVTGFSRYVAGSVTEAWGLWKEYRDDILPVHKKLLREMRNQRPACPAGEHPNGQTSPPDHQTVVSPSLPVSATPSE